MSKTMASLLLTYGIALVGLGIWVHRIAPAIGTIALAAGIAGGGLSVLWGGVALSGKQRRTWAALTVIAVTMTLLTQLVQAWLEPSVNLSGRLVLTLMFVMSMAMLMYLFHGERPAGFYDHQATRTEKTSAYGDRSRTHGDGRRP